MDTARLHSRVFVLLPSYPFQFTIFGPSWAEKVIVDTDHAGVPPGTWHHCSQAFEDRLREKALMSDDESQVRRIQELLGRLEAFRENGLLLLPGEMADEPAHAAQE